ncbi:hypothetical protein [Brevibacterium sp.]|uniref:hypothetical protein n=1 Tax=Brevibacterium sp. TaxID=1701 RepID=UPI0025C216A5|nr:hypothetical protein [Brevibacterium sp.]
MSKSTAITNGIGTAAKFAVTKDGELHPRARGLLQRALSVQRPVVLAYVRTVRRRHPDASPAEIADILRRHYLTVATSSGAAVGATAVVPGLGTGAALGLGAVETGGFLELSALYAQSLAELHGMQVADPVRANALVMGLMLGSSGKSLVKQFSAQAQGGPALTSNWGALVTTQIPSAVLDTIVKKLRNKLIRTYGVRSGGNIVLRAVPFGVGAAVGGVTNRMMASTVAKNARGAFGDMPAHFSPELDPASSTPLRDADIVAGLRHLLEAKARRRARAAEARTGAAAGAGAADGTSGAGTTGDRSGKALGPGKGAGDRKSAKGRRRGLFRRRDDDVIAGEVVEDEVPEAGAAGTAAGDAAVSADPVEGDAPRNWRPDPRL